MTPSQAREILACPPEPSSLEWVGIHVHFDTPAGSDATMREWSMQRMRDIARQCDCGRIEHGRHHMDCSAVKSNKVACTATIAQEGPEGKAAPVAVQAPEIDPGADLEVLRADFGKLYKLAGKMHDFWSDEDYEEYKAIGKKRGLE